MGQSTVVSYLGNSSLVRNESDRHRPVKQRSATGDHLPALPSRECLPNELIAHIVRVHHAAVRRSLAELMSRLPTIVMLSTTREGKWEKLIQQIGELHDAILTGVNHEESAVFPRIVDWQAAGQPQSPPSELLVAAKRVERLHACCLQMFWQLLRQCRDQLTSQLVDGQHRRRVDQHTEMVLEQLSAACDDYEQYLFDVECILLPIVTSASK